MKRALVITTAHPIDDKRVYEKVSRSFLEHGWQVHWVGPRLGASPPNDFKNVIVRHLFAPPKSRLGRARSWARCLKLARVVPAVDWIYSPDPDGWPAALLLARRRAAQTILDVHEDYAEVHVRNWVPRPASRLAGTLLNPLLHAVARRGSIMVTVTPSLAAEYASARQTPLVVLNSPRLASIAKVEEVHRPELPATFRLMQGVLAGWRGTDVALEAVARLNATGYASSLVGVDMASPAGGATAQSCSASAFLEVHSPMTNEAMLQLTAGCNAGLIDPARYVVPSLPNRLFEFMALGLPVVAPRQAAQIAQIVGAEECGLLFDIDDVDSLYAALCELILQPEQARRMGEKGRDAFYARFGFESQFSRLLKAMEQASDRSHG